MDDNFARNYRVTVVSIAAVLAMVALSIVSCEVSDQWRRDRLAKLGCSETVQVLPGSEMAYRMFTCEGR